MSRFQYADGTDTDEYQAEYIPRIFVEEGE
jgi:hypothetical protein